MGARALELSFADALHIGSVFSPSFLWYIDTPALKIGTTRIAVSHGFPGSNILDIGVPTGQLQPSESATTPATALGLLRPCDSIALD